MTTPTTVNVRLKLRSDTAANWTSANPTLLTGELGRETNTGKIKIGDGSTAWASLAYQGLIPSSGVYPLSQLLLPAGTVSAPSLAFDGDVNVGIYKSGTDQLAITTNGVERVEWGTAEVVFNDGGENYDFRIEGDTNANLFFVDASADRVGIGTSSPAAILSSKPSASSTTAATTFTGDGLFIDCANTTDGNDNYGGAISWSRSGSSTTRAAAITNVQTATDPDVQGLAFLTHSSTTSTNPLMEAMRITGAGLLLVGTASARSQQGVTPSLQVEGATYNGISLITNSTAAANCPVILMGKSKGSSVGSSTLVANNDRLAAIYFQGADGTDIESSAGSIECFVDGGTSVAAGSFVAGRRYKIATVGTTDFTLIGASANTVGVIFQATGVGTGTGTATTEPYANSMPGRLVLSTTPDNSATPAERLRITSSGFVGIGTPSPAAPLDVNAGTAGTHAIFSHVAGRGLELATTAIGGTSAAGIIYNIRGVASGTHIFQTDGNERARIDSSGRLLVGTSGTRAIEPHGISTAGTVSEHVFEQTETDGRTGIAIVNNSDTTAAYGSFLYLARTRGSSVNTNTSVSSGDTLGTIAFAGADGTDIRTKAAAIFAEVDGNPGANDMPGRLILATTSDGAAAPTERMRIDSAGRLLVGTSSTSGNIANNDKLAVVLSGDNEGGIAVSNYAGISNTLRPATLRLQRSTGSTDGSFTALTAAAWGLGRIDFNGSNGVGFGTGASIEAISDSLAWGNGDHPARLVFSTTSDGSATPTERLRIASNGLHLINFTSHSGAALSVTAPANLYISTGTYTDTTTAASGTVTHGTISVFGVAPINSTNASVTYTNASTVYIAGAPTGTGNVTVTNGFALFVAAGASRFGGSVLSNNATAGIGYATGAGGAVTQATSRTTGVTLNTICGAITLVSAAGTATWQSFTVTNSAVAATDTVVVNQKSGTDLYMIHVTNVAAGSFRITYATTGGTTTEQPVFNFSVIKAVAA